MTTSRRCGSIGLVAGILLLAGPPIDRAYAAADDPQGMALEDVVRVALERSPNLRRERTEVERRRGSLREVSGAFDLSLGLESSFEYQEGRLSAQSENDELRRRLGLSILAKVFDGLRDGLARQIERDLLGRPTCPTDIDQWVIEVDGQDYNTSDMCMPLGTAPGPSDPTEASAQALESFMAELFSSPVGASPAEILLFLSSLSNILGVDSEALASDTRQRALESVEQSYRLAAEVEQRAELALERLGEFPENEYQRSFYLSSTLAKPFHSGRALQLEFAVRGVEDNFRGKPLDPKFGGKGVRTAFRSRFGLAASQPLLRGRGSISAAAPERAARQNLLAAEERYGHVAAQQVLAACQAYFNLAAAQETLDLFQDVLDSQRRVVDGTRVLLKAREVARTELTRAQARQSELEAQVVQARQSLVAAQTALAETIGVEGDAPGAGMMAAQALPQEPTETDIKALATGARARRRDLRSATALREASHYLFDAARVDTRKKLDLSFSVGMTSDYFSPYFRVLKDEHIRDVDEPTESPVDYFNPTGFARSFTDRWQPYVSVKLSFEMPIGNHRQRGRLLQARASLRSSAITATNLGRQIDLGILRQGAVLARSAEELKQRSEAVAHHEQTWKNSNALRAAGELNLIDTLTTEQQRTAARLALVRARRDYAVALAQYRFETGTLVGDLRAEADSVDLSGLAVAR